MKHRLAGAVFLYEGLVLLFDLPLPTLTNLCRRHPAGWDILDGLYEIHKKGIL